MWRGLRREGVLPPRRAFQPRLAKVFLRNILLAQAPSLGDSTIRIRVAGDAIRQNVQGNVVGMDFLDFIEEKHRKANALDLVREMFERPCGQWWVLPYHQRGLSRHWEVTAFPLGACERGPASVLALARLLGSFGSPDQDDTVRIDAAVAGGAIDVD
jgi:hypothetical protein